MKRYVALMAVLLWLLSCWSQTGRLFTTYNQLSSSMVESIIQDSKGYVWIGTHDGLNRYDSNKFKTYYKDWNTGRGLKDNVVNCLHEDSNGRLLVGLPKGLQIYNYATDDFTTVSLINVSGDTCQAYVRNISSAGAGEQIISTLGYGMFLLKHGELEARQIADDTIGGFVRMVTQTPDGSRWIATERNGIYCYQGSEKHHYFESQNTFTGVYYHPQTKHVYAISNAEGLFVYDSSEGHFEHVEAIGRVPLEDMCIDDEGIMYIGTSAQGIIVYNPFAHTAVQNPYYCQQTNLQEASVRAPMIDKSGNLWMGIFQKGVFFQPKDDGNFFYIGQKSMQTNVIGNSCVMSVLKRRNGHYLIGTENDGLYETTSDGRQLRHYPVGSIPTSLLCLCEDGDGSLWVGSFRSGCGTFDLSTGTFHPLDGLQGNARRVFGIVADHRHHVWISTMGGGVVGYNTITGDRKLLFGREGEPMGTKLHNNYVNKTVVSHDGNRLYIATCAGLCVYDIAGDRFLVWNGFDFLLGDESVNDVREDADGNLWVGCLSCLYYVDVETGQYTRYTAAEGLLSNTINSLEIDGSGNPWLGTSQGLSMLDLRNKSFVNYPSDNLLQDNEFVTRVSCYDGDSTMLFGGTSGIVAFNPQAIVSDDKHEMVFVTAMFVGNQEVRAGMKSGSYTITDKAVIDADHFDLAHDENSFTLHLSSMEYAAPDQVIYQYSVNDGDWLSLGQGVNELNFSHLSPGTYSIRIKTYDVESSEGPLRTIVVKIHSPWWATWWMYLVYALVLGLAVWQYMQARKRKEQQQLRLQEHIHAEQMNEAKLQFFMNISHEIRTPMTLIVTPLQKLMDTDGDSNRQQSYRLIHRNCERILSLINQLMDIRKIDKGQMEIHCQQTDIVGFLQEFCTLFGNMANEKNITFSYEHDAEQLDVWIDRMNFDKVIMNLLSNAFKFTPRNGHVDLMLTHDEQHFYITVSDDGPKINEEKLEQIFERFYQISNSVNNSNVGTGIGLHLTRSLVQLHSGTIKALNNDDAGCRFVVCLPLGRDHLSENQIVTADTAAVEQSVRRRWQEEDFSPSQEEHKKTTGALIMIVEDDEEIRSYLRQEVSQQYRVTECSNGREALDMIFKEQPDLVISDVMMPEMDGNELCRRIKGNVNLNHIPVILLTAKDKADDIKEGLILGADEYIVKPFDIDILLQKVANVLKTRQILRNKFLGQESQDDKIEAPQLETPDAKLLERVMSVVNKNLANPDLSVDFICTEVGISRSHLHRKMKELTNQSTRDLIRNIRLKQAANLLASGHHNVTEVMYATGFSNPPSFSTMFKQLYGMSPRDYMAEHAAAKKNSEQES
ncbi:MAG: response regulator [Prevotella sp.]|nr:response regulator [Prevotella sp.]